ncbi:MAG: hypothetical protein ABUL49_00965 [bacterium]
MTFSLDVPTLNEKTRTWLAVARPSRAVGSNYDPRKPDRYYENLPVGEMFSGVVFIDKVTGDVSLGS